jgi:hypothetical protein
MRHAKLVVHILLGSAGLLIGPAYLLVRDQARRRLGAAYQAAVLGVAATAAILAATAWHRLWWLLPVAAGADAPAVLDVFAWRRRWPHWPAWTALLLGGSHVALVTCVLIASTGIAVFWVLPAIVAQWPITVAKNRLREGLA